MKQRLVLLLKLLVAAGLIGWLIGSGRLDLALLAGVGSRWPWLLLAQLPFCLVLTLAALRWRLLLHAQGITYSLPQAGALTLIGWFFNQLLIGTTGGDLYRAYAVARDFADRSSAAVISVFVDRAIGLLVLFAVALIAVLFNLDLVRAHLELVSLAGTGAALLAGTLSAAAVYTSRRLRALAVTKWILSHLPFRELLSRIDEAILVYRRRPRQTGAAVLASFALHGLVVVTNLCLARALIGGELHALHFLLLVPTAHAAMAIPINPPGAIGTGEAIYAYLFGLAGITVGGLICLLQRLTFYAWAIPGALLYVTRRRRAAAQPVSVQLPTPQE